MVEENAICTECGGTYLGNFTPDTCPECRAKDRLLSRVSMAERLSSGLKEMGFESTSDFILLESKAQVQDALKDESIKITWAEVENHREEVANAYTYIRGKFPCQYLDI